MKLITLLSLSLVATNAFADYKVTLDVHQQNKEPITVSEVITVNQERNFKSVKSIEYVQSVTTTTKWYQSLLGITPTPIKHYAETEVGVQGAFKISPTDDKNKLILSLNSQLDELMGISSFNEVELQEIQSSYFKTTHLVTLNDDKSCFKALRNTDRLYRLSLDVCIEAL